MSVGQKIVSLRKQKNWRQQDLADKLGVTPRQLIRWENDQVEISNKTIRKIAEVFGLTPEELTAAPAQSPFEQVEDVELRELLSFVPELGDQQTLALKIILREMVTCHQISRYANKNREKVAS
ncbi:MAG: helix-turn-helix transcriptional regulator [Candidatus Eremiobacteraeota bacterium]|nr:helix-turn-helix transcriptional regulator [Candidatus Eremiobacteraeota bacterium]